MKLASTIQYLYYRREPVLYIQHFKNHLCKFEYYNCNDFETNIKFLIEEGTLSVFPLMTGLI
jgi:hypothetical protein